MSNTPISVGANGDGVAQLQRLLRKHAYQLPASETDRSFFGPTTRQAVRQFQQAHGLPVTGDADAPTIAALRAAAGATEPQVSGRSYTNTQGNPVLVGRTAPGISDLDLKTIARRWFDALNAGDIDTLDEVVAHDVIDHSGLSDAHGYGREGHKRLAQYLRQTLPGWQSQIDNIVVDGDMVIVEHSGSGTYPSGFEQLLGVAPAKDAEMRKIQFKMKSCVRIANGKIVEHWLMEGPFGKRNAPDYISYPQLPPIDSTEENKYLLRHYVKNVIDGQNPSLAAQYFASNFFNHDRAPGEQLGLPGVRQFLGAIFSAFSGFHTTIEDQIAQDDLVVGRWSQSFTNTGPYLSFPASGKSIHIGGITITRVRDGKIVEEWEARDAVGLLVQMGVVKPLGPLGDISPCDNQNSVNEALASRFFYEGWNAGNASIVDEVVSPDFENHNLLIGQSPGTAGLKQWISRWRAAFSDMNVVIDLLISEGPKVATRWTVNGTHTGAFLGINPTNKYVSIPGITIFRIENGKIREGWDFWEQAGMLQQLGVVQFPEYSGGASAGRGGQISSGGGQSW
jgi:steroid delta-isomerase-like uncharacterized protein